MTAPAGSPAHGPAVRVVFLYDRDCGFCTLSTRWLVRVFRPSAPARAWQDQDLTALGVHPDECREAAQYIGPDGRAAGADAIAALLCSGALMGRVVGGTLQTPLVRQLARTVYRWVARHRYRLPGGTAQCKLPS